jgi:hypothetical protein
MPTATDDALGSEKWSAGLANVLFNAKSPKYQFGYLLTWQHSFAGESDRADVNIGAFQPFFSISLAMGCICAAPPYGSITSRTTITAYPSVSVSGSAK